MVIITFGLNFKKEWCKLVLDCVRQYERNQRDNFSMS